MTAIKETNIAELLREVAENSDAVTGRFLKAIDKAAKKGLCWIELKITEYDYNYLSGYGDKKHPPPFATRLNDLGFDIMTVRSEYGFFGWNYFMKVGW